MTPTGLYFHLLPGSQPADVGWALGGAPVNTWLKLCTPQLVLVARNLGARTYLRPCFLPGDDGEGNCSDGAAWAAKVIATIQAAGGTWPSAIGYRNELQATAANAAEYQRYRAALRAAGYTGLVVYGSFAVGQPDWPDYATIPADADALEIHEYLDRSCSGSAPWWTWRHVEAIRRGVLSPMMPLFVGELGSDRIPGGDQPSIEDAPLNRRGWADAGKLSADAYVAQLAAYRAGCAPSVQAAFVFADGAPNAQWDSYRTRQTPVEAYIRSTWQGGTMTTLGIDVSSAQPGTNWQQVAASGHRFALVKASEGVGWQSPTFAADWPAIASAGLARGSYHFARADLNADGAAEARYFLSVVGPLAVGDVLALDLEAGAGDLGAWAAAWFGVVDGALGKPALLYSYAPFMAAHGLSRAAVGDRPLWLAAYQDQEPPSPLDWPAVAIWQHTSGAVVPGVATACDEDTTALSADQLRALGKPAPAGPTGVAAEALAYYQSLGVGIAPDHAIFTVGLLPLYARWKTLAASGDPLADLEHPGPATAPEYGTTFGGRPASAIRLQNRVVGVYLTDQGTWRAFAANI